MHTPSTIDVARLNRNRSDGNNHSKCLMVNRLLTSLGIVGAFTELKQWAKLNNCIVRVSLLHLHNQLRLLFSRTKKDVAFFRISLSLLARHNFFSRSWIVCCSTVSAFLPDGVWPFIQLNIVSSSEIQPYLLHLICPWPVCWCNLHLPSTSHTQVFAPPRMLFVLYGAFCTLRIFKIIGYKSLQDY